MSTEQDIEQIKDLEERRSRAMLESDVSTLNELLSEQVVYLHSTGGREDKAGFLKKLGDKTVVYQRLEQPERAITVVGDTAIVVGRMVAIVFVAGEERRLDNRTLAVWARRRGTWEFLAYQGTALPKQ